MALAIRHTFFCRGVYMTLLISFPRWYYKNEMLMDSNDPLIRLQSFHLKLVSQKMTNLSPKDTSLLKIIQVFQVDVMTCSRYPTSIWQCPITGQSSGFCWTQSSTTFSSALHALQKLVFVPSTHPLIPAPSRHSTIFRLTLQFHFYQIH